MSENLNNSHSLVIKLKHLSTNFCNTPCICIMNIACNDIWTMSSASLFIIDFRLVSSIWLKKEIRKGVNIIWLHIPTIKAYCFVENRFMQSWLFVFLSRVVYGEVCVVFICDLFVSRDDPLMC